nr:EOG090X0P2R [Eubosmina coregoni]
MSQKEIEKMEEEKLKARSFAKPMTGHSAFLAKRLAKGQKYFDSGDYQMAKQQKGPAKIPTAAAAAVSKLAKTATLDCVPHPITAFSLPQTKSSKEQQEVRLKFRKKPSVTHNILLKIWISSVIAGHLIVQIQ